MEFNNQKVVFNNGNLRFGLGFKIANPKKSK